MSFLKTILGGALKVAIALFLVSIALIGVFAGWDGLKERERKAADAPLELAKQWPPETIDQFSGATLDLTTKWREGHLYYQFNVKGYPKAIEQARKIGGMAHAFSIVFYDAAGFKVFSFDVPLLKMAQILGKDGAGIGLSANSDALMASDAYRNAVTWQIEWNFPTELPKPVATKPLALPPKSQADSPPAVSPNWRQIAQWRELKKGLWKGIVEDLLGPPARIEGGGVLTHWYYGNPGTGGTVSFDDKDRVYAWTEPR